MSKSTILFVDDQEEILFLIKRMLTDEDYKLIFATSAKEALSIMENEKVDVLVTDVLMPNMSGLELLDVVKDSYPNVVRIILSGFSQIPTLLTAINRGMIYRYITKPWNVDAEAKAILKDAVDYSKLLNSRANLSIDEFRDFLLSRNETFLITSNDIIVYVHPKLEAFFEKSSHYKESEDIRMIERYSISIENSVYFFE